MKRTALMLVLAWALQPAGAMERGITELGRPFVRAIGAFDWRNFFEEISLVDATLRHHPGFALMDFATSSRIL
jgi:hypothetical protein